MMDVWAENMELCWEHCGELPSSLSAGQDSLFRSLTQSLTVPSTSSPAPKTQLISPASAAVTRQAVGGASFCTCFWLPK